MPQRGPRVSPVETVLLAGLAAWALFPLVLLLVHAGQLHARFTGADGLIGADGVLGADQLQYLAWARDASAHGGLASDLFSFSQGGHVYLQPLFAITGALYRLGLSLPLAYLLWKPVGILALGLAAVAWARRFFGDQLAARAAVVTISLFLFTPLAALYSWTQWASGSFRFSLYLLSDELLAADKLWGYVPSAIGLALVPVSLLATERALDPDRDPGPGGMTGPRAPPPRGGTAAHAWPRWRRWWPRGCIHGRGSRWASSSSGSPCCGACAAGLRWRCRRSAPGCRCSTTTCSPTTIRRGSWRPRTR